MKKIDNSSMPETRIEEYGTVSIKYEDTVVMEPTCNFRYLLTSDLRSVNVVKTLQQKWLVKTYQGFSIKSVTEEWRDIREEVI